MKKRNILAVSALILVLLFLCSGCSAALQRFENTDVRQCAETMLNALIADDFDTAYSLVSAHGTEEDFKPIFAQMRELLSDTDTYELTLLSIHVNSTVSNGQKSNSVSSVYEMTTQSGTMIVSIGVDDQIGITGFHLTPYEKTDYYFTGTLNSMKDATGVQWFFLMLNVIAIGVMVFALVDCCRHKLRKKALWILLIVFGLLSFGATFSSTGFHVNFNLGSITAYSALVRYGSGRIMLRLMLPVGAIIYWAMRRSLLNKITPSITSCETEPDVFTEESNTAPSSSQTPQDEQT